jgi:hypothetical protein
MIENLQSVDKMGEKTVTICFVRLTLTAFIRPISLLASIIHIYPFAIYDDCSWLVVLSTVQITNFSLTLLHPLTILAHNAHRFALVCYF